MAREPEIRQKSNGAWFVRWGGKDRYLSMDREKAQQMLLDPECLHSLIAWQLWREGRTA